MKIAVITCQKYFDLIPPFFGLFRRFWPDCPYPIALLSDKPIAAADVPEGVDEVSIHDGTWAKVLGHYAATQSQPLLMLQEDFWLNQTVNADLVAHGLEQLHRREAGSVRLYPCPGADTEYGDPYFGLVERGTRYRISCQATIWRSDFLQSICSQTSWPWDFELRGTPYTATYSEREVLAFRREVQPWPLEYICTVCCRNEWDPNAKLLAERYGIEVDWSRRAFIGGVAG